MMIETLKNNRLILAILGVILLVIIVGALIASIMTQPPAPKASVGAVSTAPAPTTVTTVETDTQATTENVQTDDFAELVDETLLEHPIPEDQALVKDELIQLTDIDTQLNEQKTLLEQQHTDADELIKLKEQQIAELEKQLATP